MFLVESFDFFIRFCPSERKNESSMFFSSEIELQDIVNKMYSLDNIKTAAATMRQSLLELDLGLDDKLCDAEELKEAWTKKVMPDVLLTFFTTLFNLRLRNLLQAIDEGSCANLDDENGNDDTDQIWMKEWNHSSKIKISRKYMQCFKCYSISSTEDKRKLHLLS